MGNENIVNRAMGEDRPQGDEYGDIDIIASGYEWVCPICDTHNKQCEWTSLLTCENYKCRVSFKAGIPEHAMGK